KSMRFSDHCASEIENNGPSAARSGAKRDVPSRKPAAAAEPMKVRRSCIISSPRALVMAVAAGCWCHPAVPSLLSRGDPQRAVIQAPLRGWLELTIKPAVPEWAGWGTNDRLSQNVQAQ